MNYPEITRAIETIKALRHPETGCPWDLKQTHESLLKYLIEESYEFIEATEKQDYESMRDELGDVLLQVLLHSELASEKNKFNLEDVAKNLSDKMIRRHPHVFTDEHKGISEEQVVKNWNDIKEKENASLKKYFFKDKYLNLPALSSSYKIGKKSSEVNFDWENYKDVLDKVDEELQEVKDEIHQDNNRDRIEEEIGDLLFSVAQLSRHKGIDPEDALRKANKKFIKRFKKVEDLAGEKEIKSFSNLELEKLWTQAKSLD